MPGALACIVIVLALLPILPGAITVLIGHANRGHQKTTILIVGYLLLIPGVVTSAAILSLLFGRWGQ